MMPITVNERLLMTICGVNPRASFGKPSADAAAEPSITVGNRSVAASRNRPDRMLPLTA